MRCAVQGPFWAPAWRPTGACVPVDIAVPPAARCVVISGPNTGGKTAAAKALALACLMARCGLFPASAQPASLPWVDRVLVDIGDEQSLSLSLSTFSGRLRRQQALLAAATARSLVLLDEVGAGTSPGEGAALGAALLRALAAPSGAALTLATTHAGELKALKYGGCSSEAGEDGVFENAAVDFDDVSLAPTYALLWGVPGRSRALDIAQRLGLEPALLAAARQRLGGAAQRLEDVVAALERARKQQLEDTVAARQALAQAAADTRAAAAAQARAAQNAAQAEAALAARVAALASAARGAVDAAVAAQRKRGVGPPTVQPPAPTQEQLAKGKRQMAAVAAAAAAAADAAAASEAEWVPAMGDVVTVAQMAGAAAATITDVRPDGSLTLRMGGNLTMRVARDAVELVRKAAAAAAAPKPPTRKGTYRPRRSID